MGSAQQYRVLLCALLRSSMMPIVGFWRPRPTGAAHVLQCTWVRFGPLPRRRLRVWVRL